MEIMKLMLGNKTKVENEFKTYSGTLIVEIMDNYKCSYVKWYSIESLE